MVNPFSHVIPLCLPLHSCYDLTNVFFDIVTVFVLYFVLFGRLHLKRDTAAIAFLCWWRRVS
jgi:hypothetical protein